MYPIENHVFDKILFSMILTRKFKRLGKRNLGEVE